MQICRRVLPALLLSILGAVDALAHHDIDWPIRVVREPEGGLPDVWVEVRGPVYSVGEPTVDPYAQPIRAEGTTDAQGVFRVRRPVVWQWYWVTAAPKGEVPHARWYRAIEGSSITISFPPRVARITVRVEHPQDEVLGRSVLVGLRIGLHGENLDFEDDVPGEDPARPIGHPLEYVFPFFTEAGRFRLTLESPGFRPVNREIDIHTGHNWAEVQLVPDGTLTFPYIRIPRPTYTEVSYTGYVEIVDADGAVVAEDALTSSGTDRPFWAFFPDGVPVGLYTVRVTAWGIQSIERMIYLWPGQHGMSFTFPGRLPEAPAVLRGTVLSAEDGTPVPNARVAAGRVDEGGVTYTYTDKDGRFLVDPAIGNRIYRLTVRADGFLEESFIVCVAGGDNDVELPVQPSE